MQCWPPLESGRRRSSVYASEMRSAYVNEVLCSTLISTACSSLLLLHLGVGAGQDDTRGEVGAAELAPDRVDAGEHLSEQRLRAKEDRAAARL